MMEKNSIRDEVGWDNYMERFVTTVVNQLTHVASCLRRMNVACVHRVIVLACYITGGITVIKVDLHGGHLFSNATYKSVHKRASYCHGICVQRVRTAGQRRTFLGVAHQQM